MTSIDRKDIKIGSEVEINPQSDRSRELRISGSVSKILTRSSHHPHGILVTLDSGEIGRVKKIITKPSQPKATSDQKYTSTTISYTDTEEVIREGECHTVEFKSSILWSSQFTNDDIKNYRPQSKELFTYGQKASKIIIAKTLAALLNSDGGLLIIGVKENKNSQADDIIGIEPELEKLKDPCLDGYRRMIVDLIKDYFPSHIFNHFNLYFDISFDSISEKTVCSIHVNKAKKGVFLKLNSKDLFFIRTDASTRELAGEDVVNYCMTHFEK